jgi:type VI secretion system secreted protein VgrG
MQSDSRSFPDASAVLPDGLAGIGRQAFLSSLSQHERLLSIETALEPGALVVTQFTGHEAMSGLFRFDVDCIATSAHYELKMLAGEEASLRLRLADGSTRAFHGIVTACRLLGSDGALTSYRLTLAPWLRELALRRDSYVFQDKSVPEILEEMFRDYPAANWRFDLQHALPRRSVTMQYRESDYDFMRRLLAEEGLNFFFEHDDASSPADDGSTSVRHRLVIFDNNAALAPCSQPSIRFQRAAATESDDTVTLLTRGRQVRTNAVALASWDYKTLGAPAAEDAVPAMPANAPLLEHYDGSGAYRYTDATESARIARARAESLALEHEASRAESSARRLAVGTWFALTDHADADGDYAVLSIQHRGANNLRPAESPLAGHTGIERGTYRNQFLCVPRATPIRPALWTAETIAPGAQVALITGVDGEEITTERDHRVKVQFPWQRGTRAVSGQLPHPATSNAPGNEAAGTWVRVAEPAAGANWGAAFVPRIGREMCVNFVAADIDRPVVTGQLYNGADQPPFHGADNHPGALTGIQSKEYAADGFNQWVIDDTPGQLRQRVASSYAASQLHIGYLIRQDGNLRGAYRGTGFELASDAWSTLRAARGMFVSTAQRNAAISTQLDTREAQGKLQSAGALAGALSDAALQHQAAALSTPHGMQALRKAIDGRDSADGQQAPRFEQPAALFDSAASMATATPASSVLFAGQDMTLTAATALRMTAGQAATVVSAKSTSLFTHAGGAKLIAAKEPVSLRAHTGPMDLIAEQAMTLTSSNGSIRVQAKQEVLLASGGGYVRLAGGNIDIHCPASVSVKGGGHAFLGGGSNAAQLPVLPTPQNQNNWIELNHHYDDLEPMKGAPYKLTFEDGSVITGKLDAHGFARHEGIPYGNVKVHLQDDERIWKSKEEYQNPHQDAASSRDAALALITNMVNQ